MYMYTYAPSFHFFIPPTWLGGVLYTWLFTYTMDSANCIPSGHAKSVGERLQGGGGRGEGGGEGGGGGRVGCYLRGGWWWLLSGRLLGGWGLSWCWLPRVTSSLWGRLLVARVA